MKKTTTKKINLIVVKIMTAIMMVYVEKTYVIVEHLVPVTSVKNSSRSMRAYHRTRWSYLQCSSATLLVSS